MTNGLLDEEAADRLATRIATPNGPGAAGAPAPVPTSRPDASRGGVKGALKRALRPVTRRVVGRLVASLRGPVSEQLRQQIERETLAVRRELEAERDEAHRRVEVERELAASELHATQQALYDTQRALHDVAFAIAPSAGLSGVAERFSELRSRVNDLDRAVRTRLAEAGAAVAVEPPPLPPDRVPAPFDYVAFEGRFRGSNEDILAATRERYWDVLSSARRVLDVGCGRGELLSALTDAGIEAIGVDLDAAMVAEARGAGLNVAEGDAIDYLRAQPPESFDAVCAMQVVEHLPVRAVRELVELARTRLRPGGLLLLETPNPTALFVLGNSFVLDPSHVWPLHPSLLTFLCEQAGYGRIDLRYFAPMSQLQVPLVENTADLPEWAVRWNEAFAHLNNVVYGPQDYAVLARVPRLYED
jgi:2-polyprenyl-3-methyl-5-hydroxy-6-metoxy-1,4-benzoquinol methylase